MFNTDTPAAKTMSGTVYGATKHLKCKDLHGYLKTLPGAVLSKLYNHPATCMAVFRELPCLSKHFVMRLLFVEQPVPQTVVSSWITSKNPDDLIAPLETLSGLRILQEHQLTSGIKGWVLNNTFRFNLGTAMLGGGQAWTGTGSALGADKHAKDISFLDQKAMERWECLLHFMVGSKEGTEGVSQDIVQILLSADLMKLEAGGTEPLITPGGFQFLLMDTSSQVWYFMLQYLDTVQSRGMDLVECLSFLFQLSFSTLGKDYSTEGMNDSQQRFLQHLREFGLVYQRKRKSQRYYPTRLAINLASGLKDTRADTSHPGYIVVETNYRVYAYTDSPLQVALLGLFCEMRYRFPNLSVAVVTRDSVREALCRGITAEQIISFLRTHAHSEMLQNTPILPPTITDQIRLWELERDRFKFTEGVMYNQFLSQSDFELLRDYARDLGVLTWDNPSRRVMIVTRAGHDEVKRFWKRQRHNNASS